MVVGLKHAGALPLPVAVCLQTLARVQVVHRGATGCWTPLTARAALWACGSMQCAWACCRTARWCLACWAAPTCHSLQWLMTTEVQVSLAAGRGPCVCAGHEWPCSWGWVGGGEQVAVHVCGQR